MEECVSGEEIVLGFEPGTLLAEHVDQGVQRLEPSIDDGGIGQGPEAFGGLQFG
jgi:hypothetical protein